MARDYSKLNLPVTIPHWELSMALEKIRPYWYKLPAAFDKKFLAAFNSSNDLVITKADLDSLSDEIWDVLKGQL